MYHLFRPAPGQKLLLAAALLFAAALLAAPQTAAAGIRDGLSLCLQTLIPSLFPFLFACDLAMHALPAAFPSLPGGAAKAAAWLAGQTGGFAAGAKSVCGLRQSGILDERDAALYLCGCVNAGPAFVVSAVGGGMFGSAAAGCCLFLALEAASLVCFAAVLPLCGRQRPRCSGKNADSRAGFADSVAASVRATALLCAAATLFCCIGALTDAALAHAAPALRMAVRLAGEVSGGCSAAAAVGGQRGLRLAAAAISLCGISVWGQLQLFCAPAGISLRPFLLSRLAHLPLTQFFLHLLLQLPGHDAAVFSAASGDPAALFSAGAPAALALFGSCCCALAGRRMIYPLYERDKKGV